jgi:glycosyltransferase involved in cell wall biosynthesis
MKGNKIFIGFENIASVLPDIKESFKTDQGIECITVINDSLSKIVTNKSVDYNVAKLKSRIPLFKPRRISYPLKTWWEKRVDEKIWNMALEECSTFMFFVNSFKQDHSDYKLLKEKGKKVIHVFVGDDARWYNGMKQEFESYGKRPMEYDDQYNLTFEFFKSTLRRIRMAEKYCDAVFSRLDQAQIELRPYHRWNMMVRPELFKNNFVQRKKRPVVVHAPSAALIKGTKYILKAVEELKTELDFDFQLIQNVPYEKAVKMYQECDILIDQLLCPGTGKLATEALASGKIVMSLMNYENYPQKNPSECPIIDVDPDTIKDKLRSIIQDYEFREEHAKKGRPYVEKYLDVKYFTAKVKKIMNSEKVEYDYVPVFFREKYVPVSKQETELFNTWNREVENESWYKEFIKPGERAGLVF